MAGCGVIPELAPDFVAMTPRSGAGTERARWRTAFSGTITRLLTAPDPARRRAAGQCDESWSPRRLACCTASVENRLTVALLSAEATGSTTGMFPVKQATRAWSTAEGGGD